MKRLSSLLFLSALSFVSTVSAASVFNSNLPVVADQFSITSTVGNFSVSTGNVDLITTVGGMYGVVEPGLCPTVSACVDLNGNTGIAGGVSSGNLTLAAGQYTLSFDLFTAKRGSVGNTTVTLGGLFNHTFVDGVDTPDGLYSVVITVGAGGATVPLTFASNIGGYNGDLIANVDLSPVAVTAAPEPSTMLLMSLPLLVFGSKLFRRSNA